MPLTTYAALLFGLICSAIIGHCLAGETAYSEQIDSLNSEAAFDAFQAVFAGKQL